MSNKACVHRLQKEYKALLKEPVPNVTAHPLASNLLEWHYVLQGAPDTDYEGGVYWGKIAFPPTYPYKPPSLLLYTPNGRFATNTQLCLSMTSFHPETWNPLWSVSTILTALLSFMYDDQPTTGSIVTTSAEKKRLAATSLEYNMRTPLFNKMFADLVQKLKEQQQQREHAKAPKQQQGTAAEVSSRHGAVATTAVKSCTDEGDLQEQEFHDAQQGRGDSHSNLQVAAVASSSALVWLAVLSVPVVVLAAYATGHFVRTG